MAALRVLAWQRTYADIMDADYLAGLSVDEQAQRYRQRLLDPSTGARTLVAEDASGELRGIVTYGHCRDDDAGVDTAEIHALYAHPDHLHAGVGAALTNAALDDLAHAGYHEVTLWTPAANGLGRRFYDRGGWQPDGATHDYHAGPSTVPEVRYRLPLSARPHPTRQPAGFDDLLAANETYVRVFGLTGFDGVAHKGVAMLTCMDSRLEPVDMVGLVAGDMKVLRTPGGRVTPDALTGLLLSVTLLGVDRIMVVPHTRCAMASDDQTLVQKVRDVAGVDLAELGLPTVLGGSADPLGALEHDVDLLRTHPVIGARATIGGFRYDVDTGRLERLH